MLDKSNKHIILVYIIIRDNIAAGSTRIYIVTMSVIYFILIYTVISITIETVEK
jgi:hypothetical protein